MNALFNDVMPYVALIVVCMLFTIPLIWGFFFSNALGGTVAGIIEKILKTKYSSGKQQQEIVAIAEEETEVEQITPGAIAVIAVVVLFIVVSTVFFLNQRHTYDPYALAYKGGEQPEMLSEALPSSEGEEVVVIAVKSGEEIFNSSCASCHQQDGLGIPNAFPPLAGSEWITGDKIIPIKIVLSGISGPITVKGEEYNSVMAPWGGILSDAEIVAALNYARSSWGNIADSEITEEEVAAVRAEVGQRGMWSASELKP